MIRWAFIIAVLGAPAFVHAQIFPQYDKAKIKRAIESNSKEAGNTVEKEDPDKTPDTTPEKIERDHKTVLERYDELMDEYESDKRKQFKWIEETTDQFHKNIRDYKKAEALLRLGYYSEASRMFDDVGHTVRDSERTRKESNAIRKVVDEIESGKAFYWQMIAEVMNEYKYFDSDEDFEDAWKDANKKGRKVVSEFRSLLTKGKIENIAAGRTMLFAMERWMNNEKTHWRSLYRAEKTFRKDATDSTAIINLIAASEFNPRKEAVTPNALRARALATIAVEFFKDNQYVRDGTCDLVIATSYFVPFQLSQYRKYLVGRSYHTEAAKNRMDETLKYCNLAEATTVNTLKPK